MSVLYTYNGKILDVDGQLAASADCCCNNERWRRCDNDADAAVLTADHTDVDYAWLCIGGIWVKCYNAAMTNTTPTDPDVLEQCDNPAPTSCSDLVGWPASEDFGGTGCNSGAVNDTNWNIRWTENDTNGTVAIVSSKLDLTTTGGGTNSVYVNNKAGPFTGTFDISGDGAFVGAKPGSGTKIMRVYLDATANTAIYFEHNATGNEFQYEVYNNNTQVVGLTSMPDGTPSWQFTRDGSNSLKFYVNGALVHTVTNSSSMPDVFLLGGVVSTSTSNVTYDNIQILDEIGGSDILIDPSGTAC